MKNILKHAVVAMIAFLGGYFGLLLVYALNAPKLYSDPGFILSSAAAAASRSVFFYSIIPVCLLVLLTASRRKPISLGICISIPACWLFLIFILWAYKPWSYCGEFPWWGFRRHYISFLPPILMMGWLFWRAEIKFIWLSNK